MQIDLPAEGAAVDHLGEHERGEDPGGNRGEQRREAHERGLPEDEERAPRGCQPE